MLNLNYNINKALGGGGCIGVMKFNYSASIVVAGGGGGGSSTTQNGVGAGGGGGMAVTQSISIVPNLTYQINVGAGGAVGAKGQDSFLIGFDDVDRIPISFFAGGGQPGSTLTGGNSGTGSLVRGGVVTPYPAFIGGTGQIQSSGFGPRVAGGGGASNQQNGVNGVIDGTNTAVGGNGGSGVTAGGGGGALGAGPTPPPPAVNGVAGSASSGAGIGGNGAAVTQARVATAGTDGVVIISYTGKQKAFVTGNVTTTFADGITTHRFGSGSGTFLYQYPYPWEEPVAPYQVILCPPTYQ